MTNPDKQLKIAKQIMREDTTVLNKLAGGNAGKPNKGG